MTTFAWSAYDEEAAARSHALTRERLLGRTVALVGFMGAGKSVVGQELARLLDRPFVDTDALVEQRAGCSIPELFARGEEVFRGLEEQVVRESLALPPAVLALGGGAFSRPASARLLLERALVVHLYVPWSVLLGALPELTRDRPLLAGREPWQVEDLFLRRVVDYRRAHVRVRVPRTGPQDAAAAVAALLAPPRPGDGRA